MVPSFLRPRLLNQLGAGVPWLPLPCTVKSANMPSVLGFLLACLLGATTGARAVATVMFELPSILFNQIQMGSGYGLET